METRLPKENINKAQNNVLGIDFSRHKIKPINNINPMYRSINVTIPQGSVIILEKAFENELSAKAQAIDIEKAINNRIRISLNFFINSPGLNHNRI